MNDGFRCDSAASAAALKAGVNETRCGDSERPLMRGGNLAPHAVRGSIDLLGRARIGVRFYVAPLLVYDPAQLALHYLERIVYYLRQGLVRSVIDLFFFRD